VELRAAFPTTKRDGTRKNAALHELAFVDLITNRLVSRRFRTIDVLQSVQIWRHPFQVPGVSQPAFLAGSHHALNGFLVLPLKPDRLGFLDPRLKPRVRFPSPA